MTLLNRELLKILKASDTIALLHKLGSTPCGGTPEEQQRFVKAEIDRWTKVVKAVGIRVE